MVQRFDVGPRLSEMAVHNGVCWLAGQVAADASQDIAGQTRQVLDAVDALLARAGTDTTEVLLADLEPQMLARWRGLFPLLHQRRPETYRRILDKWAGDTPPAWMEETPTRRVKPAETR